MREIGQSIPLKAMFAGRNLEESGGICDRMNSVFSSVHSEIRLVERLVFQPAERAQRLPNNPIRVQGVIHLFG